MSKMNILFVCTGNTCRSPLAEALLRTKVDGERIEVQSAGVYALANAPMSDGSKVALEKRSIENEHKSQPLTDSLLQWADLVLTMTEAHKEAIAVLFPQLSEVEMFTLKEYIGSTGADLNISDPFGQSLQVYEQTAVEIEHHIDELVKKLTEERQG